MERMYINTLSSEDAYLFMLGYSDLTKAEQNIIIYLHEKQYKYDGTYSSLCKDMQYDDSYVSEISRACHRLSAKQIIEISEPKAWYYREIYLNNDWVEKVIAIGKEISKCTQKTSS